MDLSQAATHDGRGVADVRHGRSDGDRSRTRAPPRMADPTTWAALAVGDGRMHRTRARAVPSVRGSTRADRNRGHLAGDRVGLARARADRSRGLARGTQGAVYGPDALSLASASCGRARATKHRRRGIVARKHGRARSGAQRSPSRRKGV